MTFKVIWGQGHGEEMTSVPYRDYYLSVAYTVKHFHYTTTTTTTTTATTTGNISEAVLEML